jgi:hypothetical protein
VVAVKRFLRKGVSVHPLHSFVFGVAQHQTVVKSKTTLAPGRGLRFQGVKQCLSLQNDQINHNNANNEHQRNNYFSEYSDSFNYNNENN